MREGLLSILTRPVALAMVLAVAACANPHGDEFTGSLPDDYRLRHPIQVTRGVASLDLLPGGGPAGLTDRQVGDIQAFASEWRKRGRGRLVILIPKGADAITDGQSARATKEIRRIFAAMDIGARDYTTERYVADGPGHLAPMRLEFPVLEAKLPHECGQWPDDAGYSDPGSSNRNESYWSFGCSYQQNLAAQVEDPEDFIRPRSEDPASAARRSDVIQKYRKGEPTPTAYPKENVETSDAGN